MCDSAVGPIFNENFVEKKRFVHPINNAQDPRERERERERKKKRERQMQMHEHGTQSKQSLNHKNYSNYFLRKKW